MPGASTRLNQISLLWQGWKSNRPQHGSSSSARTLLSDPQQPPSGEPQAVLFTSVPLCQSQRRPPHPDLSVQLPRGVQRLQSPHLCLVPSMEPLCSAQIPALYATAGILSLDGELLIMGLNFWVSHVSGTTVLLYLLSTA